MENLTDIAVFVAVVKADSFTRAAQDLGLSRAVVSKYITRLEQQLGVRLLNRTTRRLSLTEAGDHFYRQSESALRQMENAMAVIHSLQETPKGVLRISAPSSFGVMHLAPLIPKLQQLYPDLKIDLTIEDLQIDVVDAGIDVTIRIADMPDSSLIARRLAQCRYVVCAAPDYLAKRGRPETPEALQKHTCLLFQHWITPEQWHFKNKEEQFVGVRVGNEICSNNSLALREMLLAGAGITMAPTFLVGNDIADGRLECVLNSYSIKPLSIYAVYPHRQYLAAKVRAFLEFLTEHINPDNPYWDAPIKEGS
jgi:DNA-binding transcriptional LysR family regulator